MECTVLGRAIPMELVTYREMGFGQPVSRPFPFQITMGRDEALQVFEKAYEKFAQDEKEDAPHRRRGEVPENDRLFDMGYPPLAKLLDDAPDLVEHLLSGYMALAWVLPALIPEERPGYRFVISSLDRAKVSAKQVVLEGVGFPP